jgi:hypothetical protein
MHKQAGTKTWLGLLLVTARKHSDVGTHGLGNCGAGCGRNDGLAIMSKFGYSGHDNEVIMGLEAYSSWLCDWDHPG